MISRPLLRLLRLPPGVLSIFDQLCIEEALLRSDTGNWCIVNHGAAQPSIVMGIGGVADKLVNIELAKSRQVPVLRRFTGGGTVVVDEGTLFVSFVANKHDVVGQPTYPREVMAWSERVYAPVMAKLLLGNEPFLLREHDYCVGPRKFGGNAQSITHQRWVHHTSMLWDYSEANMQLLQLPSKRPQYRGDRTHGDFVTRLRDHMDITATRDDFIDALIDHLSLAWSVTETPLGDAETIRARCGDRKTNVVVPI